MTHESILVLNKKNHAFRILRSQCSLTFTRQCLLGIDYSIRCLLLTGVQSDPTGSLKRTLNFKCHSKKRATATNGTPAEVGVPNLIISFQRTPQVTRVLCKHSLSFVDIVRKINNLKVTMIIIVTIITFIEIASCT